MTSQRNYLAIIAFLLFTTVPTLLLAQAENTKTTGDETIAEASISNDDSTPTTSISDTTKPKSNRLPDPSGVKPMERNIDASRPFSGGDKASSTPNSVSRAGNQETLEIPNRPNLEERKAQMEAKRLELQAKQAEKKAVLAERAQIRISNFAATLGSKMTGVIARIGQVITRIESRIDKMATTGVDTSEAENYLATAKADLAKATSILSTVDDQMVAVVISPDPKSAWTETRTAYQAARSAIGSAHSNIKNAITALKNSARTSPEVNIEVTGE